MDANLTKNKEFATVFRTLGKDIVDQILESIEDRVDDDCVFYVRFDKQKAVCGEYEITHGGDVISLTAKIMSHPARKEVAVGVLRDYLRNLFPQDSPQ